MRHIMPFRSALDAQWNSLASSQLPPPFLAPQLAYLHQKANRSHIYRPKPALRSSRFLSTQSSTTTSQSTPPPPSPPSQSSKKPTPPTVKATPIPLAPSPTPLPPSKSSSPQRPSNTLSPSLLTSLPHLCALPPSSLYIRAHIHRIPFLLTAGDTLRLPFLLPPSIHPGDILRLNRATVIGSRDHTLKPGFSNIAPGPISDAIEEKRSDKATRYIDERLFECRARVMATESMPMQVTEKTKRRQRHVRRVKSKLRYTVLRVMEVRVKGPEELDIVGR